MTTAQKTANYFVISTGGQYPQYSVPDYVNIIEERNEKVIHERSYDYYAKDYQVKVLEEITRWDGEKDLKIELISYSPSTTIFKKKQDALKFAKGKLKELIKTEGEFYAKYGYLAH